MPKKYFGPLVKKSRLQAGLTLRQVAEHLGCSQPFVFDVEKGYRYFSFEKLEGFAQLLKMPCEPFFKALAKDKGKLELSSRELSASGRKFAAALQSHWGGLSSADFERLMATLELCVRKT